MRIRPNQDFRHQGAVYRAGEVREVPDEEGYYFVMVGWAAREPAAAAPAAPRAPVKGAGRAT